MARQARRHGRLARVLALSAILAGTAGAALAHAPPMAGCPDTLVGDSLAAGMGMHARLDGYRVVAREGRGLSWLRQQEPRCADRLIVVIGTNDLRGLRTEADAEAYARAVAATMSRWSARRAVWATPGCFTTDASLERGSELLDRAAVRLAGALPGAPSVHRGRLERCAFASRDGIHPSGSGYRTWWEGIEARTARPPVVLVSARATVPNGPRTVMAPMIGRATHPIILTPIRTPPRGRMPAREKPVVAHRPTARGGRGASS